MSRTTVSHDDLFMQITFKEQKQLGLYPAALLAAIRFRTFEADPKAIGKMDAETKAARHLVHEEGRWFYKQTEAGWMDELGWTQHHLREAVRILKEAGAISVAPGKWKDNALRYAVSPEWRSPSPSGDNHQMTDSPSGDNHQPHSVNSTDLNGRLSPSVPYPLEEGRKEGERKSLSTLSADTNGTASTRGEGSVVSDSRKDEELLALVDELGEIINSARRAVPMAEVEQDRRKAMAVVRRCLEYHGISERALKAVTRWMLTEATDYDFNLKHLSLIHLWLDEWRAGKKLICKLDQMQIAIKKKQSNDAGKSYGDRRVSTDWELAKDGGDQIPSAYNAHRPRVQSMRPEAALTKAPIPGDEA